MKIGYCPISKNLEAPGDYRRFVGYAKLKNLSFEILYIEKLQSIIDGQFDFIVVTMASDLYFWSNVKFIKTKIIFDCVDSYIFLNSMSLKNSLRAPAKFFSKQHSGFSFSYLDLIKKISKKSFSIVCSTENQKNFFLNFCKNVFISLDYHEDHILQKKKNFELKNNDEINLVWEGLPHNIVYSAEAQNIIEYINEANRKKVFNKKIILNVITDLYFYKYLNKYFLKNSFYELLKKTSNIRFFEWNKLNFFKIITSNDLALIPLSQRNPMEYGKPSNKLFLFYKMNMPVIASATPAYKSIERELNHKVTFENISDFQSILEHYIENKENRENYMKDANYLMQNKYPESSISTSWDTALNHL